MFFRVARHSNDISKLAFFYTEILGLELLGSFNNHNDYNGIFIGYKGADWHLEFTESKDNAKHIFDADDALVFYPKSREEYQLIVKKLAKYQIKKLPPKNPYWKENGILVKDPDDYPILISKQKIINN